MPKNEIYFMLYVIMGLLNEVTAISWVFPHVYGRFGLRYKINLSAVCING